MEPPPPLYVSLSQPPSSVPVRCTRCRRPNVLCSSGASLVQPGGHLPPLSRFFWCLACPARLRRDSVRSEKGAVVEKTGPCFIGRINDRKDERHSFPPSSRTAGVGMPAPSHGKTRWCRPFRPNMQALSAAAADTRSQLFRNLFVPHACHLTRRDAPRDRCLESDIHGRSRNMQLVSVSQGQKCA